MKKHLSTSLVSSQEKQQSQPVHRWSAHTPPFEPSPSPLLRDSHALSMPPMSAIAPGEIVLFGGYIQSSKCTTNDLYVISTRNFSTTLLQTSGDVPNPRCGHCAVFTSNILLIWGGIKQYGDGILDDSLYLLNLLSREWTRIVANGPGPAGRYYHTMTLIGSRLFVFGGKSNDEYFNDIWALDLKCLKAKLFWESYEPTPSNKKPLPRSAPISVTTGDRIIIFGGYGGNHKSNITWLNDTWSFNISTRKWTELQCTGPIPSPRTGHAAVLIEDLMYVFGGFGKGKTYLGDLTVFNLSTQRWIVFQEIGPSPSRRSRHAMVCDGTRIFVLGGELSHDVQADEAQLIHVLDTKHLDFPEPDSDIIYSGEKSAQLVQKSSVSTSTRGQPHLPSSSLLDTHAADLASPFQKEELDHLTFQKPEVTREQNLSLNNLSSRPTGVSGKSRSVPGNGEGSTEHAKPVAPDGPSGKEVAQLENGRLIELEQQLSETLVARNERDLRIEQLIDELALKSAQAAEEKKHARQEQRELQMKLDESLLSQARDHALQQVGASAAAEEKGRTAQELCELQAKADGLLLSRDQAEANAAEVKKRAGLEQRELQAKIDELMVSHDEHLRMLEQAQSALQKAVSRVADADEPSQPACQHETELAKLRAELPAVHLRLMDAEEGWAKCKVEADAFRACTQAAGLVNMDVDRVMKRLMERVRAVEAEVSSLRGDEKSIEEMEIRNEG